MGYFSIFIFLMDGPVLGRVGRNGFLLCFEHSMPICVTEVRGSVLA